MKTKERAEELLRAKHTFGGDLWGAAIDVITALLDESAICNCDYCDEHYGLSVYDPDHGDYIDCQCGHTYERHFDTYDNMRDVGCKYCYCNDFKAKDV